MPGFWARSALRARKPGTFVFFGSSTARPGEMCQVFGLAVPGEPRNLAHLEDEMHVKKTPVVKKTAKFILVRFLRDK